MNTTLKALSALAAFSILFLSCTDVQFNHPLDAKGTSYIGIDPTAPGYDPINDPLADNNGNGILNYRDPTWGGYVRDTTKPVITILSDNPARIPEKDPENKLAFFSKQVNAADDRDGPITDRVVCTYNFPNFTPGTYQMRYTVCDLEGNCDTAFREIIIYAIDVVDTTGPLITLNGFVTVEITVGGTWTDPGAEAWDMGDQKACEVTISGTVDSNKEGAYTLTYTSTDTKGNKSTKTRTVNVVPGTTTDNKRPVITLNPPDSVFLDVGQAYVEPGYTATDDPDGDVTANVVVQNPVDINVAGIYRVSYSVSDKAGNTASIRRYVKVGDGGLIDDPDPPVITLVGGNSVKMSVGSPWVDPGCKAMDEVDGDLSAGVKVTGEVNTAVEGTYKVTYTVSDAAGNEATAERTVVVSKSGGGTPPEIKLIGDNPDTITVGKAWKDPGCLATDGEDGNLTSKVTKTGTVDTLTEGTYTITYSVTDKDLNKTEVTRTVLVTSVVTLFQKYGVPSPDPLPKVSNTIFENKIIEGDVDQDLLYSVTKFTLNWDPPYSFQFALNYSVPPHYLDLKPENTFGSAKPGFTLEGSQVEGLDGKYYIVMQDDNCIWVREDGSFAIIWSP
ncbi:MAG: DUF5011 domain-containing protein [Fibrobacter sp.]|nr:DUF5011 domain-containing protein [Fibrobacter sp.]